MNPGTGKNLVQAAMLIVPLIVGINFFKKKDRAPGEGFRTAWALGALFIIMALGADVAPEVAGPLALLLIMGVLFFDEQTIGGVIKVTGGGG